MQIFLISYTDIYSPRVTEHWLEKNMLETGQMLKFLESTKYLFLHT